MARRYIPEWGVSVAVTQPILGQIAEIKEIVNAAFDAQIELAGGTIEDSAREAYRAEVESNRIRTVKWLDSMYNRRRVEAEGHYKVVSAKNGKGLAFNIFCGSFLVFDRLQGKFWREVSGHLTLVSGPLIETGWVDFDQAPPELVGLWNRRDR